MTECKSDFISSKLVFQHFLDVQMVGKNQYSSSLLHSHDTDTRATINMAVGDGVIAAGQDGTCSLMKFKLCQQKEENATHRDGMVYNFLMITCCFKKTVKTYFELKDCYLSHLESEVELPFKLLIVMQNLFS